MKKYIEDVKLYHATNIFGVVYLIYIQLISMILVVKRKHLKKEVISFS